MRAYAAEFVEIHLVSTPVYNTSVNRARRVGPALFVRRDAIAQRCPFSVAPLFGAVIAAGITSFVRAIDLVAQILALRAQAEQPGQQEAKVDVAIRALSDAATDLGNRA